MVLKDGESYMCENGMKVWIEKFETPSSYRFKARMSFGNSALEKIAMEKRWEMHGELETDDYDWQIVRLGDVPIDYANPDWEKRERIHNWRNHVRTGVREIWSTFTDEQKQVLAREAHEDASNEAWD
jgi:hypothetical protein